MHEMYLSVVFLNEPHQINTTHLSCLQISILMSEFKRVLPLYTICITENNAETGAPVNGENKKSRNASTNVQEVGRPVFARIETRPDMDNFPNELRLGVGNVSINLLLSAT